MAIDPHFAPTPETRNIVFRPVAVSESLPFTSLNLPDYTREDIASLEADIACWERTIACNRKSIPEMEREILECERDAAVAKLQLIELRAKLAAQTGGAQ